MPEEIRGSSCLRMTGRGNASDSTSAPWLAHRHLGRSFSASPRLSVASATELVEGFAAPPRRVSAFPFHPWKRVLRVFGWAPSTPAPRERPLSA